MVNEQTHIELHTKEWASIEYPIHILLLTIVINHSRHIFICAIGRWELTITSDADKLLPRIRIERNPYFETKR